MPLEGADQLIATIKDLKASAPKALGAALYAEAVNIIGKADEDVPYEFGNLRRSHYVTAPQQGPSGLEVELGYGAGYGLFVHEIPANHPKGGKDHFLRDAMAQAEAGMADRIAAYMDAHPHGGADMQGAAPSVQPNPMDAINADRADRERARRRGRAAAIRAQNAARRSRR
jgi:hypothetical protein